MRAFPDPLHLQPLLRRDGLRQQAVPKVKPDMRSMMHPPAATLGQLCPIRFRQLQNLQLHLASTSRFSASPPFITETDFWKGLASESLASTLTSVWDQEALNVSLSGPR
jgi:hypothetical protein